MIRSDLAAAPLDRRLSYSASGDRSWASVWLYVLTIAGYPLVSAIPILLGVGSRVASMPFRAAYLALALFVLARNIRIHKFYLGTLWLPVGLFWFLYLWRLSSDMVFDPISLKLPHYEYVAWALGACFLPMLAFFCDATNKTLRTSAIGTLCASTIAGVVALYLNYKALIEGNSDAYLTGRLGTATLTTISLGHLGVTIAILAAYLMSQTRGLLRLGLAGIIALGLFTTAAAASRGPVVALIGVILFQVFTWARGKRWSAILPLALGAILLAGALIEIAHLTEDQFGFRIASRFAALSDIRGDESSSMHLEFMRDAATEFLDHPFLGSALDEKRSGEYPHNVVIESFMATGIFGGIAFCAFLAGATLGAVRLSRDYTTRWLALLFVQQLMAGLISGALYLSGALWCLAAAMIGIESARRTNSPAIASARTMRFASLSSENS